MPFDYQKFISERNKLIDEMEECYDEMADEVNKRVANFAAKHKKYRQTHTNEIKSYEMADEENKADVAAKHKKYRQTHTNQIKSNKQRHYQENKDEIKCNARQYYQDNKDEIKSKKRQYYQDNKDEINSNTQQYYQDNKDEINSNKQQHYQENKDEINSNKRQYYQDDKDEIKRKKQQYYQENKDEINSNKQRYYQDNKDEINSNKRKFYQDKKEERKDGYAQNRAKEFDAKGNFTTTISEIPCDTTEYEIAPSPETAVINWYMCTGTWRLQWLMEDIQDLMIENGKSESQIVSDKQQANNLIKKLNKRISKELITPEKRKNVADKFYRAIGKGCSWGSKPCYDENSIDAKLLGCAVCGMKEYDNTGEEDKRRQFKLISLSDEKLDIFKLDKEAIEKYKKQTKMTLDLPDNDEGHLKEFRPWLVRSIYCYINPDSPNEKTYYYFHPELIMNKSSNPPTAVLCPDCALRVNNGCVPANSIADGVDFGVPSRIGLVTLTARELYIIAKVRHYINMVKVESNSRTLKEHQQSALKGCTILFEHDAP